MNTFTKKTITIETALNMARTAMHKASEIGILISVTILDESGVVKAFARMDGAPLISVDASRKKAVTAVGLGLPSGQPWFDFIKDDPILREGVGNFSDFMLLGGGFPIVSEGQMVGSIGISGGHYRQDEICAQAALELLK